MRAVTEDAAALPAPLRDLRVVDAHVHAFPPRVASAIWRWFDRYGWDVRYKLPAEEVLAFLLDRGVDRVVGLAYAHVPGLAATLNAFMAELAAREPRLVPCATVCPGEDGARAILDHALGTLGCRGVKLHCHVQCVAADDPRLDEVYDAAAGHGVPVVIHAGDAPVSPHHRCDVTALCRPDALARAIARHPRTTFLVPHLGAGAIRETAALLDRHENLHLDTTMVLARYFPVELGTGRALPGADELLAEALEVVRRHPTRVLYGSDFPNIPYAWDRELAALAGAGLPPGDLAAVAGGNAARLFGS